MPPSQQSYIVTESQRLRDYLLHKGGVDQRELIDALKLFEGSSQPTPDDYSELYAAIQSVKERCVGVVDDLTLSEVLRGESPFLRRRNVFAGAVVTLIGVILVLLAVHFTNWSQRATYLLAEADRFVNFDHFGRMTRLIELAEMIGDGTSSESTELPSTASHYDLTPEQIIFLESINELRLHYAREYNLFANMADHIGRVNPASAFPASLRRRLCPPSTYSPEVSPPPALSTWQRRIGCLHPICTGCISQLPESVASLDEENKIGGENSTAETSEILRAFGAQDWFQGVQGQAMRYAERRQFDDYSITVQQVENWTQGLEAALAMISRVLLPIVYGALGSIVYCMWRILNPATSPLGFWYTLLRTAFSGLAALTLSSLIVPSNTLAVGTEVTRPFVYMLSFIFGYSIEAFVNTLNALNRVLVSSIAPREKK